MVCSSRKTMCADCKELYNKLEPTSDDAECQGFAPFRIWNGKAYPVQFKRDLTMDEDSELTDDEDDEDISDEDDFEQTGREDRITQMGVTRRARGVANRVKKVLNYTYKGKVPVFVHAELRGKNKSPPGQRSIELSVMIDFPTSMERKEVRDDILTALYGKKDDQPKWNMWRVGKPQHGEDISRFRMIWFRKASRKLRL
ncbi:hypothetical protein BDW59DRAFT_165735 [Aspergillus cavernicola]|uniref:Uncharacterized protein n=1 Tax=Aspergillus cavernicola TaxID=176166 RepID=A0ABR4HR00_9EURO